MKKIGLAINYDYPDYGGMLQSYALYLKLNSLGYDAKPFDIDNLKKDINRKKWRYFLRHIFDGTIVAEKSRVLFKKIKRKFDPKLNKNLNKRYDALDAFSKGSFNTIDGIHSWNDLSSCSRNCDCVIVGSDQLWLPSNIEADYYTLSFVPEKVTKIAYATSFGVSKIQKDQASKVSSFLSRFEHLSAREYSGQEIIKQYANIEAELVCDPTMLLSRNEWDCVCSNGRVIEDEYIFCYFMGDNPWQREFVSKLKKRTGLKIVSLLHLDQIIKTDEKYCDYAPFNVSPSDFINLVKNAKYVCTDSFHGSVFSLIYNKTFYTFMRFSEKATLSTNNRIVTLLDKVGLSNALVEKNYDFEEQFNKTINFEDVNLKMKAFRESSLSYLLNSIEK